MNETKENKAAYGKTTEYIYSTLGMILVIMTCVFILFTFFFRLVEVSGSSMIPNLYNGDKIIVSNFLYNPGYSDIIAIGRSTEEEPSIIKRVIALPGDTVNINFDTHLVTVNGDVILEKYPVNDSISKKGDMTFPLTVPEDCVFVLGDNRNNSIDSRFSKVGFIRLDEITGKALFRLVPFGTFKKFK